MCDRFQSPSRNDNHGFGQTVERLLLADEISKNSYAGDNGVPWVTLPSCSKPVGIELKILHYVTLHLAFDLAFPIDRALRVASRTGLCIHGDLLFL